jgi:drug/metabolite transporter (DMT)-like permease
VITAIFSTIILKKKFTKSATLGCLLAFLGITIVQIFEITLPDDSNKNKDDHLTTGEQIVGIVFLLVSLFFHTGTLIS